MVVLTLVPVALIVPTFTVEPLVGAVIVGLAVLLAVRFTVTLASLLPIVSVPVASPDVVDVYVTVMVVPLLAVEALIVVGLTEKPVPLTLTLKALLRSLPFTVMVLLTLVPVALIVPTFTVEPLVGAVIVGLAVVPLLPVIAISSILSRAPAVCRILKRTLPETFRSNEYCFQVSSSEHVPTAVHEDPELVLYSNCKVGVSSLALHLQA